MNCWIWIILLWSFFGGGCCRNNCVCCNERNNDSRSRDTDFHSHGNCGCDNDLIQPRGFAGFGDNSTCGCEEKKDNCN